MGDEARVILDAVPEYVMPAQVSFIASDSQFTPKTVETEDERKKLMFRVNLRISPEDLKKYYGRVKSGLKGAGFVLTSREAKWPAELQVKLPPAPAVPPVAEAPAPAAPTAPTPAPAPVAPSQAAQAPATPAPASVAGAAPEPPPAAAPHEAQAPALPPAPVAEAAPTPPSKPADEPPPAAAPSRAAPASTPVAKAPAVAEPETDTSNTPVAQEAVAEFAPENIGQLTGAWVYSVADCAKLFQRRGKALAYKQPIDKFAQAAIVESQRIRLPSATCQLERASQEGGALKVSADCQDSISYTSRTVFIKFKSDNEVLYSPTGDPVLATTLLRCPL
jgi:hypothetical protein